jgi:hypothetical protein
MSVLTCGLGLLGCGPNQGCYIYLVNSTWYTVFGRYLPRFARHAVVPRWIRFISAFPARRLVGANI